ncbi:MAG: lipid-A-disaccharide synthase [Bryobacteraceae bacterium]|nr:lipid-A-disaccharide synthase [Bryobacteraceae bacterium]MCX7605196.1 lipid-A-disaccharide synthase [Bryobacteraceae bacterium]
MKILASAGEPSGDRYAAGVVRALARLFPEAEFFGCPGPEMRAAGVRAVAEQGKLAVVGLVEVVRHIPAIYGEFRRLAAAAERERPAAALLVDSAAFHLRLAARLRRLGVPVFHLVAPQAWAWREGRVRQLRRNVAELHCIFPFEEDFFRARGVNAVYIGNPAARTVRPSLGRAEFFSKHRIPPDRPLITLCPGSRRGEIERHLPVLRGAVERVLAQRACTFLLAAPAGSRERFGPSFFDTLCGSGRVRYCEGETWDAMAHADLTLAASGTVTTEAALLGSPMVIFYRVHPLTYLLGRPLVRTPYFSIVNLVAGGCVAPELIQNDMTPEKLAGEALRLLADEEARARMRAALARVREALATGADPYEKSAARIAAYLRNEVRS